MKELMEMALKTDDRSSLAAAINELHDNIGKDSTSEEAKEMAQDALDAIESMKTHTHVIGDVTNLQSELNKKAPLNSPAFTGTPTAVTPSASDNSGKLATTEYVTRAVTSATPNVTEITGNAGTATKLKTARNIKLSGDASGTGSFDGSADVNIAVTVADNSHSHTMANITGLTDEFAKKAPIASPTFTGSPKAPTVATGTYDTQLATTEYVSRELDSDRYFKEKSQKDEHGVFKRIKYTRKSDNKQIAISVLSEGTAPNYTKRVITYYKPDGSVLRTESIKLTYDVEGDLIKEEAL